MSIHLYKHNEDAYRAVETMLEEKQMAAVIHPTGTGKSMIAFKLVEQHPHKHFLWLSPSEYIYKTQLENIDTQFSNIEYMSYSRLMKHEDSIDTLHPDYIILDEFHRCGAAEWGKSVSKLLEAYPKAKRLGLSATNIRYLDNQRNMAEELFEGNIASEMTLGEAIVREILPEPKYVIAMYSYKKELEQLKKRIEGLSNPGLVSENEKLLEQLKRALEQADGLTEVFARQMTKPDGKYIVFCSGREHMDEMKAQAADWFSKVDKKPHIYTAYYNEASTSKAFAEFKKDTGSHLKLLYCIDMLNEGIHVDDVDGVILLRPTVSPIIYLQQIGRALSAGSKNQPVIFDLVNNFDSLYCIDCLKNEMQEAFLLYPDTHSPREHFDDRFRIIDETKDSREIYTYVNFATIVLFPDGLYDAALYAGNYWFLGYKNVMIRFLLPAIVLNAIWTVHNKGKYTVRLYLLIIISIATEWMVDCKTGLIGIIIVVATMIIFTRKQLPKFINARNGLLFIGVLSIALATTSLLDEFSDLLLDMGETVSVFSRQAVWFRAIQLFVKSPVWGYGIRTNDGYRELINLSTGWGYFSHPHNYILYVLIQGGILELMLISYLIIKVTRMCLANRNNYMAKMLLVFYIASFVMGITESLVGYTLLFPIALYVGLLYEEEDYESISGRT